MLATSGRFQAIALGILIALPVGALAFVKPLRVIAPGFMPGIECPGINICTDDVSRLDEAKTL